MTAKQNLRFFLALGHTKMVLVEENDQVELYTSPELTSKSTVRAQRIKEAVSAR